MRLTELVTPLKPLEAMAQERIVVASSVGGHRELIRDHETGYLSPPNKPEALADGLWAALADRDAWPGFGRGRSSSSIRSVRGLTALPITRRSTVGSSGVRHYRTSGARGCSYTPFENVL
jgi:glycosyltransferase involved in cell wall biosynthesis